VLLNRRDRKKLAAAALATALCSSCASLAHEKTRQLCAPGSEWSAENRLTNNRFMTACIIGNNATILRAQQDFSDYAHRFNKLASNPQLRAEYQALRSKIEKSQPARARELALNKLGSLNQWLIHQEGLDLHRWHAYSPAIQRVVASQP
jgi:hypothetical protein